MAGKSAWSDTNGAIVKIDENKLVIEVDDITVNKFIKVAAQSKFVEPLSLQVMQGRAACTIIVGFNFLGEITKDRHINVKVVILDSSGKEVFSTEEQPCKDARLDHNIILFGPAQFRSSHENTPKFQISSEFLAEMKGARIIFENVVNK